MTRGDFQRLADLRALDGAALVAAGRPEAAYYLLGYAVECALKACVAKQVREFDFPDKRFATKVFTHDLKELLLAAGLQKELAARIAADRAFEDN